jgi:8-hydroxy-5-deazaflavin:NADPH oxidoreductase
MRTAIIGAGSMGVALARHFARLGHRLWIANSKGAHSLSTLAAEIGATPASVAEATRSAQIVVLAIPTKAVAQLARAPFAGVSRRVIVIDIGNYHPELRDGRIATTVCRRGRRCVSRCRSRVIRRAPRRP